jgi:hypothetical protein
VSGDWACEAYGPEGAEAGARCFVVGGLGERVCLTREICTLTMARSRRRLWQRIQELAAQGDETAVYLAGEFTSPEDLLGGSADAG